MKHDKKTNEMIAKLRGKPTAEDFFKEVEEILKSIQRYLDEHDKKRKNS